MISPRCLAVASSYSCLTARMLAPVGPSILPRSTIAAFPASSASVTSCVFFLGGIALGLLNLCCATTVKAREHHETRVNPATLLHRRNRLKAGRQHLGEHSNAGPRSRVLRTSVARPSAQPS